jgi:hypothetical protein
MVPEDAYTRDRVGFDALREDDEERSLKGGRRAGVGAGEGVGFVAGGAITVGLYYEGVLRRISHTDDNNKNDGRFVDV